MDKFLENMLNQKGEEIQRLKEQLHKQEQFKYALMSFIEEQGLESECNDYVEEYLGEEE